jgi:UDP-glucose 4-epimerase
MKIFITGSTGFLGKSIMQFLPEHEYFCYKRGTDICKSLQQFKPDVIIHSAGEIYDELKMYESNVFLTHSILEWVAKNEMHKMIYFGSSSEYGIANKAMAEHHVCKPVSLYAATKLIGTQKCIEYAAKYNKDICVIRPFSVFGINEPGRRLIPTLLRSLKSNCKITLIKGYHDFIYIKDFIRCVDLAIKSSKTQGQIFNAGSGVSYSNEVILNKMKHILNIHNCSVEYINKVKTCDSQLWLCDVSKSHDILNFSCAYTVDQGLTECTYLHENYTQPHEFRCNGSI